MPKVKSVAKHSRLGSKLKTITVEEKLKILNDIDAGLSMPIVCERYGIKKSTFYDIRRDKQKIRDFAEARGGKASVKKIKTLKLADLDEAVFKWYKQERSVAVAVRGVDLQMAAVRLAQHLGYKDFKASPGWLFRFRTRHCISNRRVVGESASADLSNIGPFRQKLLSIINDSNLLLSQVYNADETGLYWRAPPTNTQAVRSEGSTPGCKIAKDRISALMCANADGSHKLKLTVVGKYKRPRCLKNYMDSLPVHYYNNKSAWFDREIFKSWFFNHAVPEIYKDQMERQKIERSSVKAILLLDNAPAHPDAEILQTPDGKIKALFLPPNTTSVIQPMDQGVIECCKRYYRSKLMNECFVVEETEADKVEDTRGLRTLQNLKAYNLRKAIMNVAEAWQRVSSLTLSNAWHRLLKDDKSALVDFTGFEPEDFMAYMNRGVDNMSEDDVIQWLETDDQDPGYQHLSEAEIAESVAVRSEEEVEEEAADDTEVGPKLERLSSLRECCDKLMTWLEYTDEDTVQHTYAPIRYLRAFFIQKQQASYLKQLKVHDFFKPISRPAASSSDNEELAIPSTSGANVDSGQH